MAESCSNCGRPIQPDFLTCPYCGTPLGTLNSVGGGVRIRYHTTRAASAAFVGLSALILAFAAYIAITTHDVMALLLGIFIVILLWVIVAVFRPGVN